MSGESQVLPALPSVITLDPAFVTRRAEVIALSSGVKVVSTQEDYDEAELALKRLTTTSNSMEAYRKSFAAPFLEAQRLIKSTADKARLDLESEKDRVKELMKVYLVKQAAIRREEEERIAVAQAAAVEAARGDDDPFAEARANEEAQGMKPTVPDVHKSMSSSREVWTFEIVNPNNVPREYCVPCEKKIRAAIQKGDIRDIPGVRIYSDVKVQSR